MNSTATRHLHADALQVWNMEVNSLPGSTNDPPTKKPLPVEERLVREIDLRADYFFLAFFAFLAAAGFAGASSRAACAAASLATGTRNGEQLT